MVKESEFPPNGQHHVELRCAWTDGSLMTGTRPCARPYNAASLLVMLGTLVPNELKPLRGVSAGWVLLTEMELSARDSCSFMGSYSIGCLRTAAGVTEEHRPARLLKRSTPRTQRAQLHSLLSALTYQSNWVAGNRTACRWLDRRRSARYQNRAIASL